MYESLRGSDERLRGTNKALMTRTAMHPLKILAVVGAAFLMWGLLFAYASSPAQAATLTVNSLSDTMANDGQCTLREAIFNANANDQSGSTDCAPGSGSDTIRVGVTGTVQLTGELPNLSSDMSIEGPGADQFTVRRNTGGDYRIFTVTSDGTEPVVSISGITISNGNVPISLGGGILNFGTLTISGSTISGNRAGDEGGGVSSTTSLSGPKTTITNSTISGNYATARGGGVSNNDGLTVVEHSTITKNTAPSGSGSGVASFGSELNRTEVLSSIISGNTNTDVDYLGVIGISTNSFVSKSYNLIGDGNATDAFGQSSDQTNVGDPKLGALADNGGPTNTHALLAASPTIDKGNTDLTIDQRGEPRPFDDPNIAPATGGDNSDIGSFEAQSVLNTTPEAKDDAYSTDEDAALTVSVTDGVLANDAGDALTAVLVDDVDNGDLTLNSDGSFDYTPNADYNGPDSFTYKAAEDSNTATVSITLSPVNDAPTLAVSGGSCLSDTNAPGRLNFTVGDVNSPLDSLVLSATSSDTTLIPDGNLVPGGNGTDSANRSLSLSAAPGKSGSATLTLSVSDTTTLPVKVNVGTKASETITGTSGADVIFGLGSSDILEGGGGPDLICGGGGNDTVRGGGGNDVLDGGRGADRLNGGAGNDRLLGKDGTDTLTGGNGSDFFSGGAGVDVATDYTPNRDTKDSSTP